MPLSMKIQELLRELPASLQAEVLDFVEYLKSKADRGAAAQECRDGSNPSLYVKAVREMAHEEPTPNSQSKASRGILEEALSLPAEARIFLIERLQASLDLPIQDDIDRLWREEVERRVAQIERGEVELIPGEEVFAKIRERYKR